MPGGLDPIVMFFGLGLLAGALKADLRLPPAIYEFVSTLLLLSIGMKGGIELAAGGGGGGLPLQIALTLVLGILLTFLAFFILRGVGRLDRVNAAAVAAHYGSVSVATFAVGVAFLTRAAIPYEPTMPLLLVLLEIPAIVIGILLAKGLRSDTPWGEIAHEVLLGRSVLLLLGGLFRGTGTRQAAVFRPFQGYFGDFPARNGPDRRRSLRRLPPTRPFHGRLRAADTPDLRGDRHRVRGPHGPIAGRGHPARHLGGERFLHRSAGRHAPGCARSQPGAVAHRIARTDFSLQHPGRPAALSAAGRLAAARLRFP